MRPCGELNAINVEMVLDSFQITLIFLPIGQKRKIELTTDVILTHHYVTIKKGGSLKLVLMTMILSAIWVLHTASLNVGKGSLSRAIENSHPNNPRPIQ